MTDRTLGVFALVLAAFITMAGIGIEAPFSYEPVGPRAFPMLLGLVIGLAGLRLAWKGGNRIAPNAPGVNSRILLMVGATALYALLFQWLGFVLSTALTTVLVGRLFGGGWIKCLCGGMVMGAALFLLFDKVLDVVLPTGILEGLL